MTTRRLGDCGFPRGSALRAAAIGSALVALAALGAPGALHASGENVPLPTFNLPPGGSITVTFRAAVDNPMGMCASAVQNQGIFSADNSPPVLTDDPATGAPADPTVTVLDVVDLTVTKTNGVASSVPGAMTTYTITVSNAGPAPALGAMVNDTFPAALTGVMWTCSASAGSSCPAGPVAGNIATAVDILAGGSVVFSATGTIDPAATGSLVNTATATKPTGSTECVLADNSATDTDTLTPQADLGIDKTDGVGQVNAGDPTTYTITVTNSGPSDAVGATVADTFPAALTGVMWTCSASPGSSCTAGPVAGNINDVVTVRAGGTLTYSATGTVDPAATGSLVNTATVSAPGGTTDGNAANDSSTDTDTIVPRADLAITKSDGVTTAVPGLSVSYTIVASNNGPSGATGATVADTFPATLTCTWSCVGAGGGTCTAGPVAGDINDMVNLPSGGTATYTASCTIADDASGSLVNTATVTAPGTVHDPTAANDSATDTDTLLQLDYGDAPGSALGPPWNYPTLLGDGGARHGIVAGFQLGAQIDGEPDGQPTLPADGDDVNGVDDEDGVVFTAPLVPCLSAGVQVTASAAGKLDAWIDFSADGDWADAGEQVFTNQTLALGANNLTVDVPCGAVVGLTYARFRFSSAGGLGVTGVAADGEVEDYRVAVVAADLSITKTDGSATAVPGGPIVYTITVSNAGPSDAPGTTVTDTFPAAITGVMWTCSPSAGSSCTAGPVAGNINDSANVLAGGTLTYTATGTINPAATGSLANTATVSSPLDTNAANDSATDTDTLTPMADLSITKDDSADPPPAGQDLIYTITVHNNGPSTSAGATVTDPLPAAVTYVSDDCGASNVPPWTWNVGPLAPNADAVCHVTVSINPMPPSSISNTATVVGGQPDPAAGNNSDTETTTLDAVPPEVDEIDTVDPTPGGDLAECETAQVAVTQFLVAFSEDVAHASAADPMSATNPANYRLVSPVLGSDYDTTSCAGGTGADAVVTIGSVSYDTGSHVATVHVNGGTPIADRQYRLLVCGTIRDIAGNQLDGGGGAGTDFRRDFRVDRANLFANGHFDCDLSSWTSTNPAGVEWDEVDRNASPLTGSAHNTDPMGPFNLAQCVPVVAGGHYDLDAALRIDAAAGPLFGFQASCTIYPAASCGGSPIVTQTFPSAVAATAGGWVEFALELAPPAGAASARCRFTVSTPSSAAYDGYLDSLFLGSDVIFADGFESGDTSQWSATVP